METIKKMWAHKIIKIFCWVFLVLFVLYAILVIVRVVQLFNIDKTNAQVEKIHNTKLTLDDVMGKNLPPDPGVLADKTVAGVDANKNGIRDDVELAVFNTYPNSAKTRAVLLQYALALQMETVQPFINTTIATEVIREEDRAYACVGQILVKDENNQKIMNQYFMDEDKLRSFIKKMQINTKERDQEQASFYENLRSYNSLPRICDIDYSTLPN
ncbi:hypothetical protein HY311_02345 [Candidatus Nomurabacteria bacterium]|nr:hypothetical protein [Candidatus Nomurabacteria bacterium]